MHDDKDNSQEALMMERVRNMDQDNIRQFRFLEKMNNENNTIINIDNLGVTGKNMMLSGSGFDFNMRDAKALARQNLQNMSDQSQHAGFGSTFNHQQSMHRANPEHLPIDQISGQSVQLGSQSKMRMIETDRLLMGQIHGQSMVAPGTSTLFGVEEMMGK